MNRIAKDPRDGMKENFGYPRSSRDEVGTRFAQSSASVLKIIMILNITIAPIIF
jgi:hypothetical protein